jgi:hypothetical protein|tara:strand:- start:125 stop:358 length:234 start_codon:yes stop_codon:yes gene_type:complete
MADPGVTTDDLEKQAAQLVQQANEVMGMPDISGVPANAAPQDDSVVLTVSDDQASFSESANEGSTPESKAEIAKLLS